MWIYMPGQTGSPSLAESAASISPSDWQAKALAQSATWRGKHSRSRDWSKRCNRAPWTTRLSGRMPRPSTARRGLEQWTASLRASRASLFPLPESEPASPTSDGSGERLPGSFARHAHGSCFWKTCRDCYLPGLEPPSETYSDRWPTWGSMRSGVCYRQAPLVPRKSECGGSAWPTARTRDGESPDQPKSKRENNPPQHLSAAAQQWGAPRASDGEKGGPGQSFGAGGVPLSAQAANQWATPTTPGGGGKTRSGSRGSEKLLPGQAIDCLAGHPDPEPSASGEPSSTNTLGSPRRLNPIFVAWLMGYPVWWAHPEWINFGPSATQWFRFRRLLLSAFCGDECSAEEDSARGESSQ